MPAPKTRERDPTPEPSHLTLDDGLSIEGFARPSEELIIGLVGPVGAGVSTVAKLMLEVLEEDFDYKSNQLIKASDLIIENAPLSGETYDPCTGAERIDRLQNIGNKLRQKFGGNYIIEKAIEKIATHRVGDGFITASEGGVPLPKNRRHVTIVDSLKNPKESDLLREIYGGIYWQFSVFCPGNVREQRLLNDGVEKAEISKIFERDENEEYDYGQKVRDTSHKSDFFIRNDKENDVALRRAIYRFLDIIFDVGINTPTIHEAAMYTAVSAAAKSACLSRQVGAAIYSKDNELLGVGWNDVPKFSGGLYSFESADGDHRCFRWGKKICHNDDRKARLYEKIFLGLDKSGLLADGATKEGVYEVLRKSGIKDLLEFSRSVHAEMEAIVSAARSGKLGLVGSRLYSTTFPCHNCARHIVAAGIQEVYYIEPYAKSLALELHSDSITTLDAQDENKVAFLQYEGVGPRNMLRLFQHGSERKENGVLKPSDRRTAKPVFPPPIDGFTTHEKRVMKELEEKENAAATLGQGRDGDGSAA